MAAPTSRHAARAALVIERCYEPDTARQVAALLAVLAGGSRQEATARDWSSQAVNAEELTDAHPHTAPTRTI
jgi:hypothetical protein